MQFDREGKSTAKRFKEFIAKMADDAEVPFSETTVKTVAVGSNGGKERTYRRYIIWEADPEHDQIATANPLATK